MITSKLSSKTETAIPQPVQHALGLGEGDEITDAIDAGRVVMTKAPHARRSPANPDGPSATFAEWNSEADARAFATL